jgi:hypothetical protein
MTEYPNEPLETAYDGRALLARKELGLTGYARGQ